MHAHSRRSPLNAENAMTIEWAEFVEVVRSHDTFLLTSHIRPDCDALGSEIALALILEALGKQATIVNGQATPPNLQFVDPDRRIRVIGQDVQESDLESMEVIVVLDTSAWIQLGPMAHVVRASSAKKVVVDHHISEDDLGAVMFKDATAEATGRLVAEAADQLGVELTPDIAGALFYAVATDTGWFRFSSTTAETYRLAGRLVDAGAEPDTSYRSLYEQDSLARVRLRGLALSRVAAELDGRLVHTYVRGTDYAEAGALPSDTEDIINLTLAISGTEVAIFFSELVAGGCKVSLRSRCDLDCSQVAAEFGGGGHRAAAGAFIDDSLEAAKTQVLDAVRAAMR